jgi:serine/threonine protein kinase
MILFIMVAQHPPFSSATPKDPYYKCIAANRSDIFWKTHCKSKKGGLEFFSEEFKDIFEKMVSLDPNSRLSIDDILNHPWLEGEIATPEEIKYEFKKRNKEVQANVKADADNKKQEKA